MIISARVRSQMEKLGVTQTGLAQKIGITQGAIAKIVTNDPNGSSHLHKIARVLETTAEYLTGETDDASAGAVPPPTPATIAQHLDLVGVQQIDLAFGLGATFTDSPVEVEVLQFPRTWVEAITSSPPALLTWARGRGDSMVPTIHDGDLVLLDRSQRRVIEQDALWAFTVGDVGAIKRLRIKGDRILIFSDNPSVPPDEEPIDFINIVARVIFIGKRT